MDICISYNMINSSGFPGCRDFPLLVISEICLEKKFNYYFTIDALAMNTIDA